MVNLLDYKDRHTDKELFRRIAHGDEAAFTEFYYRYTERLHSYIAKITGYDLWAEEIAQDILLKLWTNREDLQDVDYPSGYLYRMAANRTLDHIKHHAVEIKVQYYLSQYNDCAGRNFTEEELDFRIGERLYKNALNKLPAGRRRVYELRHEEGLSYDEIAERLQISKHTVRNQLADATEAVRAYLIENGGILLLLALAIYPG